MGDEREIIVYSIIEFIIHAVRRRQQLQKGRPSKYKPRTYVKTLIEFTLNFSRFCIPSEDEPCLFPWTASSVFCNIVLRSIRRKLVETYGNQATGRQRVTKRLRSFGEETRPTHSWRNGRNRDGNVPKTLAKKKNVSWRWFHVKLGRAISYTPEAKTRSSHDLAAVREVRNRSFGSHDRDRDRVRLCGLSRDPRRTVEKRKTGTYAARAFPENVVIRTSVATPAAIRGIYTGTPPSRRPTVNYGINRAVRERVQCSDSKTNGAE